MQKQANCIQLLPSVLTFLNKRSGQNAYEVQGTIAEARRARELLQATKVEGGLWWIKSFLKSLQFEEWLHICKLRCLFNIGSYYLSFEGWTKCDNLAHFYPKLLDIWRPWVPHNWMTDWNGESGWLYVEHLACNQRICTLLCKLLLKLQEPEGTRLCVFRFM